MSMKKKSVFGPTKRADASGPHKAVLGLLREAFGRFTILEEERIDCSVKGNRQSLSVDLVIKELKVAIEVHGQQHFHFVAFFHPTPEAFKDQQRRDQAKAEAIVNSGFTYMVIRWDEIEDLTAAKLAKRIAKAIKENS